MEAPKKIYIDDFGSELSFDWNTEHSYENDIEYVRKDVFIEKIVKYLYDNNKGFILTEKDIDDFKKDISQI